MFDTIVNEAMRLFGMHKEVFHNVKAGDKVAEDDVCKICRSLRRIILGGM